MSQARTVFFLMRHARTVWNEARLIQGQSDTPLSQDGLAQAATWHAGLAGIPFDRVLTSDLGRARETARIVAAGRGLPCDTGSRLREQDYGAWVGKRLCDAAAADPGDYARRVAMGWEFRPPGGESRAEVCARVRAALAEAAARHPGERILVVAHEGSIKWLLLRLLGHGLTQGEPNPLHPYHGHEVGVEGDALRVLRLNIPLIAAGEDA